MTDPTKALREAAQAVLDRWDSPQWEWAEQGPTADLMHALRAALAAQAQAKPVRHEFRWLNPGNNPHESIGDWQLVFPRSPSQTLAARIAELQGFRYDGKPVYEVRGLYAGPASPSTA